MNSAISGPPSNEFLYDKSSTGPDSLVNPVSAAPSYSLPSFERKQSGRDIGIDGNAKMMKPPPLGLSLSILDNTHSRRGWMASDRDMPLYDRDGRLEDDDDDGDDVDDDDDDDDELSSIEPLDFKDDQEPALLVKELTALDGAMVKSQDSQQRIHDWDKKMGLKRSHSKTMRLSSRSRKKVRALLKRELSLISQQSKSDTSWEGGYT
jgi:hypothetical protein